MGLTASQTAFWAATSLVEVAVLILAFRRGAFRAVPFFSAYISFILASSAALLVTYSLFGLNSLPSARIYWTIQALQLAVRAAAVYEICFLLLSPYVGVWRMCKGFLSAVVIVLVGAAVYVAGETAGSRISATILAGERGLEITIFVILAVGVIFCRYYRVLIKRHLALLALGFGFYSMVQVANNTFLKDSSLSNFAAWQLLRNSSFLIGTLLWLAALWKPLPFRQPALTMLESGRYEELAPEISQHLHELNTRLLEMWK